MKPVLIALLAVSALTGCKKIIEKQKENLVLSIITDGQWTITRFVQAQDTITSQFSGFTFQFNRDYSVEAIRNSLVEEKGTWQGDTETMNITANFSGSNETLKKINGVWHIYQNTLSSVQASQSNPGMEKSLRLDKK
jgi:DNA-binding transcriptional regulator of glucitol operon